MHYQWDGDDLLLALHVQPMASRDEVAGLHGSALKVRITASPIDGAANLHLIRFLAKCCGVRIAQVQLLSGISGRNKRLRIVAPLTLPPGVAPKAQN